MQIECREQKAVPALMIRTRTTMDTLPRVIGENYGKIMGYLAEIGKRPAEAPYTCYHNMDMEDLDVEMGVSGGKGPGRQGCYRERGDTRGEICVRYVQGTLLRDGRNPTMRYLPGCGNRGMSRPGAYYEVYYNSPGEVPEAELLTKIMIPVK